MPDLLDLESGLAGEYDGSTHRGLREHTEDNAREECLEDLGVEVVRATSLDLGPARAVRWTRPAVVLAGQRRAAAATRAWGWRPHPLPWSSHGTRSGARGCQVPRTRLRSLSQRSASRASAPYRVGR